MQSRQLSAGGADSGGWRGRGFAGRPPPALRALEGASGEGERPGAPPFVWAICMCRAVSRHVHPDPERVLETTLEGEASQRAFFVLTTPGEGGRRRARLSKYRGQGLTPI